MRLVTRSDFDGLACAVLLKHIGMIDSYKFAHPKDLQDGLVEVSSSDILANVPFVPGCGMWFDHHKSEHDRLGDISYKGLSKGSPSCARVIWEYFGGHERFDTFFDTMLLYVDKVDSGDLTLDEVLNPTGWVLLGAIMDPRTGLGRYRDYRISNYQLMLDMIDYCSMMTAEEILAIPDVKERVDRYLTQQKAFAAMLKRCSTVHKNVVVVDLRNEQEIFTGNRFTLYALYPDCNISVQVMWGLKQQNTVFTVGYSILNRTATADVGALMLQYGGGGHLRVGTCQVENDQAARVQEEILAVLQQ